MLTRFGKNLLLIVLLIIALVLGIVMIDIVVLILGTITYYVEDFLGIPSPAPPWMD